MHDTLLRRRQFLKAVGLASAAVLAPTVAAPSPARGAFWDKKPRKLDARMDPPTFKKHLAGPILSFPTTFHADQSVNYDAINNMVERAVKYGVPVYALTGGNSKYSLLTYDEIKAVSRRMVEAVANRGLTIAASYNWPTEQTIDYARFCESVGAHAVQIMTPKDEKDEDKQFEHCRAIASATRLPLVLHGEFSRPLLTRLVEIDSIVAMKEDTQLAYYIDRIIDFGKRIEIFGGGAENRYLVGYPYGARAFYSTYTGFAPDKPMQFWKAIRNDDLDKAVKITTKYDYPFIQRFSHPFWHATLEYFGVAERYLREPMKTYTDDQMAEVKAFFDGQGIDPADYA